MKLSLGTQSILLFILSLLFLFLLTLFESSLSGLSLTAERIISALLLVLPGVIGLVLGIMGILRKESPVWVAVLGMILNGLFVLFQTGVLLFAG
jgi:hypothetical protein